MFAPSKHTPIGWVPTGTGAVLSNRNHLSRAIVKGLNRVPSSMTGGRTGPPSGALGCVEDACLVGGPLITFCAWPGKRFAVTSTTKTTHVPITTRIFIYTSLL